VTDTILLVLIVAGTLAGGAWISVRTRHLSHPVALIAASFFLPLGAALLRRSDLQAPRWSYETYVLVAESYLLWLVFPSLALALWGAPDRFRFGRESLRSSFGTPVFLWYARLLAMATIAATLVQNYLVSGLPILLADPELAYQFHTTTVPGLQILPRAGFAACALLHFAFYLRRRPLDLVLLALVFLSPLTKLARIDLMLSAVTLLLMNVHFPVVRPGRRTAVAAVLLAAAFVYGMIELGNQRINRFGKYTVSYADAIGFRGYRGPGETIAVAYGYFALSFENLDRFVKATGGYRTGGYVSFNPLFNTFFFVNRLTGGKYPGPESIVERRNPVGPMATVETSLANFYLDFGAGLAWVPMLAYMGAWIWLYLRRRRSVASATAYCLYSAAMMLSAFQGVVTAPFIYQGMALGLLPLVLQNRLPLRLPGGRPAVSAQGETGFRAGAEPG
jgi:hypothetical protein